MTREVEERIVAMYFDNKDFEKNAKTTIETLGQLKDGLELEETTNKFGKAFENLSKKLNLDKVTQGASKLKNIFTNLSGSMEKVFQVGSGPVQQMDNIFSTFRGYLAKFIGFDIAGKVVSSVESALRRLTIAPISAGWGQYETTMDSIQTIMNATGKSMEYVNDQLDILTTYANKTVFSLTDMTSNLGKFVNSGMDLDKAVVVMQGVANATAAAGQGSKEASMAFYNIGQAYGVGKMTTMDWKSIENANIATMELKNTFLEVAGAAGKVHKEVDKATGSVTYYWTKDSQGRQIKDRKKWVKLTAENFRETLKYGWLDQDVMERTFRIYSGQEIDGDIWDLWGFHDEESRERMRKIGTDATEAATQVRTFSKMMDALGESFQSGWAKTFEQMFGDLETATKFWTKLNGVIEGFLDANTNAREEILNGWLNTREITGNFDDRGFAILGRNGREIMQDTIFEILDLVKKLGDMLSDAFGNVFGKLDGKKLFEITQKIEQFVLSIDKWLGDKKSPSSRISKIRKALEGLFTVIKVIIKFVRIGIDLIGRIAAPVFDFLLNAFAGIGQFLEGLGDMSPMEIFGKIGDGLSKLWEKIKMFFTRNGVTGEIPAVTFLKNSWASLKKTVRQWANDSGLGPLFDTLSNWAHKITDWEGWTHVGEVLQSGYQSVIDAWEAVKAWPIWQTIGAAISDVWAWIQSLFTSPAPSNEDERGFPHTAVQKDPPIVSFLSNLWEGVQTTWRNIQKWDGWEKIAKFLNNTWGWIQDNFGKFIKNFTVKDESGETAFSKWIKNVYEKIQEVWNWVSEEAGKIAKPVGTFLTNAFDWIKEKAGIARDFFFKPDDETGETPFSQWIGNVWVKIQDAWNTAVDALTPICADIGGFLTDAFTWIKDQAGIARDFFFKPDDETGETPFSQWIKAVWRKIQEAWNWVDKVSGPIRKTIANFLANTFDWIKEKAGIARDFFFKPDDETGETPFSKWIGSVWDAIQKAWEEVQRAMAPFIGPIVTFLSNTWAWLQAQFNGTSASNEDERGYPHTAVSSDPPIVVAMNAVLETIRSAWEGVKERGRPVFEAIANFVSGTWSWIIDQFKTTPTMDEEGVDTTQEAPVVRVLKDLVRKIEDAWNWVVENGRPVFEAIGEFLSHSWAWFIGLFKETGGDVETGEEPGDPPIIQFLGSLQRVINDLWSKAEQAWKDIRDSGVFQEIWDFIVGLWNDITGPFRGTGTDASTQSKAAASETGQVAQQTEAAVANTERTVGFFERIFTVISNVFDRIKGVIDANGGKEITDLLTALFDLMKLIITELTRLINDVVEYGKTGSLSSFLDFWGTIMKYIWPFLLYQVGSGLLMKGSEMSSLGTQFLEVCAGMLLIAVAFDKLAQIKKQAGDYDFYAIATMVIGLISVVGAIIVAINKSRTVTSINTKWYERVINNFTTVLGRVALVFVAMKMLPDIISAIGDARQKLSGAEIGEDVMKSLLGLAAFVAAASVALIACTKAFPQGINIKAAVMSAVAISVFLGIIFTSIVITVATIAGVATLLSNLAGGKPEEITAAMERGVAFLGACGDAVHEFVERLLGHETPRSQEAAASRNAKNTIDLLTELNDTMTTQKINGVSRIINLLATLTVKTKDIDATQIGLLGQNMINIVDAILSMSRMIDAIEEGGTDLTDFNDVAGKTYQKYVKAIELVKLFMEAIFYGNGDDYPNGSPNIENLVNAVEELAQEDTLNSFVENLKKIVSALGDVNGISGIEFDGILIVKKLYDAIQTAFDTGGKDLPPFDATPVVDAIVEAIGIGKTSIAYAVHDFVQEGLDLVAMKDSLGKFDFDASSALGGGDIVESVTKKIMSTVNDSQTEFESGMQQFTNGLMDPTQIIGIADKYTGAFDTVTDKILQGTVEKVTDKEQGILSQVDDVELGGSMFEIPTWVKLIDKQGEEASMTDLFGEAMTESGMDTMFDTPMEIRLTPVFDMSELTPEKIQEYLDQLPIMHYGVIGIEPGSLGVNFNDSRFNMTIQGISSKLDTLIDSVTNMDIRNVTTIGALGARIDNVSAEMARMKVLLDGRVLVGALMPEIDAALNRRFVLAGRTGTVQSIY